MYLSGPRRIHPFSGAQQALALHSELQGGDALAHERSLAVGFEPRKRVFLLVSGFHFDLKRG